MINPFAPNALARIGSLSAAGQRVFYKFNK